MFQSCACRVRPEGNPGSPVGGDLRKRINEKRRYSGCPLGELQPELAPEKPAKPEHGCLKPARTIPENLDRGVSFAKKILTLRWPVTEIDRCNACEP
jgi:hypothetical protein